MMCHFGALFNIILNICWHLLDCFWSLDIWFWSHKIPLERASLWFLIFRIDSCSAVCAMGGVCFTFIVLQEHQRLGVRFCSRKEGTGVAAVDLTSISQKTTFANQDSKYASFGRHRVTECWLHILLLEHILTRSQSDQSDDKIGFLFTYFD